VGPARWTTSTIATRRQDQHCEGYKPHERRCTLRHASLRAFAAQCAARLRKVERVAERRHATKFLATHDPPAGVIREMRVRVLRKTPGADRTKAVDRRTRGSYAAQQTRVPRECVSEKPHGRRPTRASFRRATRSGTWSPAPHVATDGRRANRRSGIVRCVAASGSATEAQVR